MGVQAWKDKRCDKTVLLPHRLHFGRYILLLTVLFLFWVKHFPPAKYEEAILDPASREGVSERGREQTVAGAEASGAAT